MSRAEPRNATNKTKTIAHNSGPETIKVLTSTEISKAAVKSTPRAYSRELTLPDRACPDWSGRDRRKGQSDVDRGVLLEEDAAGEKRQPNPSDEREQTLLVGGAAVRCVHVASVGVRS